MLKRRLHPVTVTTSQTLPIEWLLGHFDAKKELGAIALHKQSICNYLRLIRDKCGMDVSVRDIFGPHPCTTAFSSTTDQTSPS